MPTEDSGFAGQSLCRRRILRLAFGTATALCLSQVGAWPLSFVTPVLVLMLLSLPLSRPPPRFFMGVLLALIASLYGAFALLPLLLHQRVAGLILLSLALFHSFYRTARGGAAAVGTLITIGLTLTVAVGSVSVDALVGVAGGVSVAAVVGIAVTCLSHLLLPDPRAPADLAPPVSAAVARSDLARRDAMRAMVVVLPVAVWFLWSSTSAANAAVMIKVAAMGQEASGNGSRSVARSLLLSTLAGGVAAVIGWQCLLVWPSLTLYTLLIALASLLFGTRIFQGAGLRPDGATWSYALLTMVVILAPAVLDTQFGSAADARFYQRLLMFVWASLYGVGAVAVFDAFCPRHPVPDESRAAPVLRDATESA